MDDSKPSTVEEQLKASERPLLPNHEYHREVRESKEDGPRISEHEKFRIAEENRRVESIRGLLLETINVLFKEYGVKNLKYFRMRVEDSSTVDELKVASDMLMTIGRFHETAHTRD